MKLPRLFVAAAAVLAASCVATMRPEEEVSRIGAPDLSVPLVESYPALSEPRDGLKAAVFARINRDRAANGFAPVAWDEAVSRLSDSFCAQQVRERTRGHFLLDGLPPYARASFAGIFGLDAENSASALTTGTWAKSGFLQLALSAHERMMRERPPGDGHRRAILDAEATHVGVGYFGKAGQFQMTQEFLARRLDRLAISRRSTRPPSIGVEGRVRPPDSIQFVTIAREPKPARLKQREANSRTRYSYPEPSEAYVPEGNFALQVVGAATFDRLHLRRDREFSFTYQPNQAGLFTFVFYVGRGNSKKTRQGGSATVLFE